MTATLDMLSESDFQETELDAKICVKDASDGWHQFGISVAHASAWVKATTRSRWTVILEQDAGQATPSHGKSWYDLANWIMTQAPKDAEFIWLSGQAGTCKSVKFGWMKDTDPLLVEGSSFCPHTYAITAEGARKLLAAGRKRHIYAAVDIFLIHDLTKILRSYMVNDERLVAEGLMGSTHRYFPRNAGIGFQSMKPTDPDLMWDHLGTGTSMRENAMRIIRNEAQAQERKLKEEAIKEAKAEKAANNTAAKEVGH